MGCEEGPRLRPRLIMDMSSIVAAVDTGTLVNAILGVSSLYIGVKALIYGARVVLGFIE